MTPQELKNSVLQQAFQGKLVEQRPEEGTGEELFQQIQAAKVALIAKKEKALPQISEDAWRFDIPDTWHWCYIGDLFQHNTGKALNNTNRDGTMLQYITTSNLYWNRFKLDRLKEMPFTDAEIEKCTIQKGDLLVCEGGDCGRAAIWSYNMPMRIQNHIHRLRPYGNVSVEYFYYIFYLYKNAGWIAGKGIGIQGLSSNTLHSIVVPLPPVAEQKRIVAKLEEILPFIDRYEAAWNKLEDFNKRFPGDMQKSILQLAIQGKLVEQRPEEGTGEELFRKIQVEKHTLIKAGKIKKEKPLPEIAEDEIPFDVPDTWKWVRFAELMNSMSTGPFGSMLHKSDYVENGIPLVNPANIISGCIVPSNKMMVSPETVKRLESYKLFSGMIIMGRRGEMGRCAVVREEENGWLCGTGSFFMMPSACMHVYYISTFFSSPYAKAYLSGASVGTTMSNLNHKILSNMPVPLPPLAEQKRIIAKLEEILPLCDRLK